MVLQVARAQQVEVQVEVDRLQIQTGRSRVARAVEVQQVEAQRLKLARQVVGARRGKCCLVTRIL